MAANGPLSTLYHTLPGQYATLICGRASKHGGVSI